MSPPKRQQTRVISVRLPLETAAALEELARESFNGSTAACIGGLLRGSGQLQGLGTNDEGFNSGLRQGLHEARVAIQGALKSKWR